MIVIHNYESIRHYIYKPDFPNLHTTTGWPGALIATIINTTTPVFVPSNSLFIGGLQASKDDTM
jgi:hypothetical protein